MIVINYNTKVINYNTNVINYKTKVILIYKGNKLH